MTAQKFIAAVLIISSLLIFEFLVRQEGAFDYFNSSKSKLTKVERTFFADFQKYLKSLKDKKSLPIEFNSIQFIKYNFHSTTSLTLFGQNPLPIPVKPSGQFFLEVDFISMPESPSEAFILQLGLVKISSNNKIWENSENFNIAKSK